MGYRSHLGRSLFMVLTLVVIFGGLLSGCANGLGDILREVLGGGADGENTVSISQHKEQKTVDPVIVASPSDADEFLAYYQLVSTLSRSEKNQELHAVRSRYQNDRTVQNGLRHVLALLANPSKDGGNQKEALNVLGEVQSEVLKKKNAPELTPIIHFLWDVVRSSDRVTTENARLQKALMDGQGHIAELEKQINALKVIEKSIHEREAGIFTDSR